MREVRIHLTDYLCIGLECLSDAVKVSVPEPPASSPVHNRDASVASHGEVVSQRAGPVRGPIVHDENSERWDIEKLLNELREILALVVGRDDYQRPHHP